MSSERLLNDSKRALADELKKLEKASRRWRAALMVEIEGTGRFDEHACRTREGEFAAQCEAVEGVSEGSVPETGLLAAGEEPDGTRWELSRT